MKVCHHCNAVQEDTAAFCTNCGNNLEQNPRGYREPAKEEISVGGWIGRYLIPYIPLVGGIVYLIMLFIWSGDRKKEASFRNWAKAQLILMAIAIVVAVLMVVLFGASFAEVIETMAV